MTRAASLRNNLGGGDNNNKCKNNGGGGFFERTAPLRNLGARGQHQELDEETVDISLLDNIQASKTNAGKQQVDGEDFATASLTLDDDDEEDEASVFSMDIGQNNDNDDSSVLLNEDENHNKWASYSQLSFSNLNHCSLPVMLCDVDNQRNSILFNESEHYCDDNEEAGDGEKEDKNDLCFGLPQKQPAKQNASNQGINVATKDDFSVDFVANFSGNTHNSNQGEEKANNKGTKGTMKRPLPNNAALLRRCNSTNDVMGKRRTANQKLKVANNKINQPTMAKLQSSTKPSLSRRGPKRNTTNCTTMPPPVDTSNDSIAKNDTQKSLSSNDRDLVKATTTKPRPRLVSQTSLRELSTAVAQTTRDGNNRSTTSRPRLLKLQSLNAIVSDKNDTTTSQSQHASLVAHAQPGGNELPLNLDRMASRRKLMAMRWEMCA